MALNKPTGDMLNAGSNTAAQDLGTAAGGTSSSYSRADHVHKLPSAADVGAVATSQLGVVSGVATLDAGGKLTPAQIPALTTSQIAQITPAGIGAVATGDVIGISRGGTGSTTAAAARTALDITPAAIGAMSTSERSGLATLTAGSLTTSQVAALTGDVTSTAGNPATVVGKIQGKAISSATPTTGQTLVWDGAQWAPATSNNTGGGGGANGLTYFLNQATAADAPATNLPGTPHQLGRTGETGQTVVTTGALAQNVWTLIAGFVSETAPQDPATILIPAGLWDTNIWCFGDANINAGTSIRARAYIYSLAGGGTLAALGSPSSSQVINGTSAQYSLSVLVSQTAVLATDRIYIALEAYATGNNHSVTAQFGDSTPSHVHTSLPLVGGTGLWKNISGALQSPASLLFDADVDAAAAIANSKIAGLAASATSDTTNAANITSGILAEARIPTLNQNSTGTAANVTGVVALLHGGTGSTDQQSALNALASTKVAGTFLRGDGANVKMSAIQASDVPTLNQNSSGTAAGLSAILPVTSGGTGAIAPHDALFNLGSPTHQANCRTTSNIVPTTVVGTFTTAGWINGATTITLTAGNTGSLAIGMVLGTSGLLSSSILALPNPNTITLSSPSTSAVSVSTNLVFYNTTATTMTIAATGVQVLDGQTVAVGDVVAFTNQSAFPLMGPWVCTTAGAVGVQPVYERPSWFTGTSASPVLMHIAKGLISIGQVYSIYPTVAAAVNVGFVAFAASLVIPRGTTAGLGVNTFGGTQIFAAGTATTSPCKFQAGVITTAPIAHAVEWDNTSLYLTNSSAIRKTVAYTDSNITGTAAGLSATLAVASGGTGATTLTGLVKGTGATAMVAATAGTDYVVPSGNITGTAGGLSATLAVANGGTGQTTYANGQLLIGNATGGTLAKATLTQGSGIAITNGAGAITVAYAPTVSTAAPTSGDGANGDFWYQY